MTPRPTWRLLPCGAGFPKTVNVKLAVTFVFRKQRKPLVTSLQSFASRLPTLLAMCPLLRIQGLGQADPESTAEKSAKDCDDDAIGFGAAVLRVIKPWAPVWCFVVRHEF